MTIFICDDDISVLHSIEQVITDAFAEKHNIFCFESAGEMNKAVTDKADLRCDLLIADVRLSDENGINAAHFLKSITEELHIIFITAFPEEVYEDIFCKVKPYGFLAKPLKTDRLITYISEIENLLEGGKNTVNIKYNGDPIVIYQERIMYLESEKRQVVIHCNNSKYSSYVKLQDVEPCLEKRFIRCHKSYIVNLDFVLQLKKGEFIMANGEIVPISRQYEKEVRIRYFMERGNVK